MVYLVFLLAGDRGRWLVLLAASLVFYATLKVPYLLAVLDLVAITTYLFGIQLDQTKAPNAKLERNFGYFALYLSFCPKLLQGPIERAGALIPQLKEKYQCSYDNITAAFGKLSNSGEAPARI